MRRGQPQAEGAGKGRLGADPLLAPRAGGGRDADQRRARRGGGTRLDHRDAGGGDPERSALHRLDQRLPRPRRGSGGRPPGQARRDRRGSRAAPAARRADRRRRLHPALDRQWSGGRHAPPDGGAGRARLQRRTEADADQRRPLSVRVRRPARHRHPRTPPRPPAAGLGHGGRRPAGRRRPFHTGDPRYRIRAPAGRQRPAPAAGSPGLIGRGRPPDRRGRGGRPARPRSPR